MSDAAYAFILEHLGEAVPFAAHVGVQLTAVADGTATALLPDAPTSLNHVGSQHAGALFTVAEAASGAAMVGALHDRFLEVRPLVRSAAVTYRKVARGPITASAATLLPGDELRATLDREGRVEVGVEVAMTDAAGGEVASLHVDWVVSTARRSATPAA